MMLTPSCLSAGPERDRNSPSAELSTELSRFQEGPGAPGSGQNRHGAALGLEDRLLDVAEILAVDLERHRLVADDLDPVEVVRRRASSRSRGCPREQRIRRAHERATAATRTGATRSRPSSNSASGAIGSGSRFAYVYGDRVRDERERGAAEPFDLERRLEMAALRGERPHDGEREREVARAACRRSRVPSRRRGARPRRRGRRPRENANRRPLTRPSVIRRVRRCSIASASWRAAATGSAGSPSARGRTLVPPPGRKPIGTSRSSPFSASLKPPSPEKTTIASRRSRHASPTSSVACRGRSVMHDRDLGDARELALDGCEPLLA